MNYAESSRRQAEELRSRETVRILALETSCDETAAAVVENGRKILSNVVFSQIDLHELYGGVVPEIASRAHMEACDRVVDQALREAGMELSDADALAVTKGPGLVGALLTGVNCMKGIAFAAGKPLIGVNHIEGHVSANYLSHPELEPPFLCLVVSGGHSHLVEVADYGEYRLIGQTVDDAAGEAFDKAARALGLPYPGGPRIDALAEEGNALPKADLAASFRRAVCRELIRKAEALLEDRGTEGYSGFALAGGVSANRELRRMAREMCAGKGIPLYMPEIALCTDNGAMIGSAAYYRLLKGETAGLDLNAMPALRLV